MPPAPSQCLMNPADDETKAGVAEVKTMPDPVRLMVTPNIVGRQPAGRATSSLNPVANPKAKLRYGAAGPSYWTTFWRDFSVDDRPLERCHIPGDGQQAVDGHWAHFADGLASEGQVIDLGCGAGILGRVLIKHRRDLRVAGVDFAQVPAIIMANLTIHPWVSMDDLPFGDASFDAAASLFGIEYGQIDQTARELARVLKPGAPFSFLIHHHQSEIVREGAVRQRGLRDLLSGRMRAAFLAGAAERFEEQYRRLETEFPKEPSVKMFSDHFRRNLTRSQGERHELWQKLADALDPEITLTLQMEKCAKSAEQLGIWLVPLLSAMRAVRVSVLRRASGEPIAWDVSGVR